MRPHHHPFLQNLIALLMGLTVLCESNRAFAQGTPEEVAERFRNVCATFKAHPTIAATEEELRDCYDKNLVSRESLTLEGICQNFCGIKMEDANPAEIGSTTSGSTSTGEKSGPSKAEKAVGRQASKPGATRKLTPDEKCRKEGKVLVKEPELDESGRRTGRTKDVCVEMKDLHARILKIEEILRHLPSAATLAAPVVVPPAAPQLMSADLDDLCPPVPDRPNADLRTRCEQGRLLTYQLAREADSRARGAEAQAQRVNQRVDETNGHLNDIVAGRVRLPPSLGHSPHLWLSLGLPLHVRNDFRERFVGAAGAQFQVMGDITSDLQWTFLAGIGMGLSKGDNNPVGWLGGGLLGSLGSEDVKLEGLLIGEHRFRPESLAYYGPRLGVGWFPGLKSRKGFSPLAGIGAHLGIGRAVGETPSGETQSYLDGTFTLELTIFAL